MKIFVLFTTISVLLFSAVPGGFAEQCGWQAGGASCPQGYCCSKFGWCGTTAEYCSPDFECQKQCWSGPTPTPTPPSPGPSDISRLISYDTFEQILKHRNDGDCLAKGFYTYDAFITAAKSFPDFANIGDDATRKKEIAAFLGQTSHETNGGWATAPDGPYSWGYCFKQERFPSHAYCSWSAEWPCAAGKQYYGRGPIQLSWNYNYGQCGRAIGQDLLNNPDLVASDPAVSFKTALWFWMTPQSPKPSSHDVITGRWTPTGDDWATGRYPGYGVITNIINGGLECGKGWNENVENRIGYYKRYCDVLGVGYGDNLDCYNQRPFGNALLTKSAI